MSRRPSAARKSPAPARSSQPRPPFTLHGDPALDPSAARMLSRLAVAVAVLFGIALLAMELGPHRIGDYFTETDFYGGYADGARALQRGQLDPARYGVVGPVYDVALALV